MTDEPAALDALDAPRFPRCLGHSQAPCAAEVALELTCEVAGAQRTLAEVPR